MNNNKSILRAVQLIDENIHFIHSEKELFFGHWGVTDAWKITDLQFVGAYLNVKYDDNMDSPRFMQIPLFDYVAWRRKMGQ